MMKIFDFNIHLPYIIDEDVNVVIAQDMSLGVGGIQLGFDTHKEILKDCVGANFLLFNTELFDTDVSAFFQQVNSSLEIKKYTALIDFRRTDINDYIDNLVKSGVNAVMVNSYLQQIEDADFNSVLRAFRYAECKGLIICIDGSYGTSKMYTYEVGLLRSRSYHESSNRNCTCRWIPYYRGNAISSGQKERLARHFIFIAIL